MQAVSHRVILYTYEDCLQGISLWIINLNFYLFDEYTTAPEPSSMLFSTSTCSFLNDMVLWKVHGSDEIGPSNTKAHEIDTKNLKSTWPTRIPNANYIPSSRVVSRIG